MAQVIPFVAKAIAGYFFTAGTAAFAITNYAVQAGLYYLSYRILTRGGGPAAPAFERPLNSRRQYLNEPNAPLHAVYGEAMLAPTILADFSDDYKLNVLSALCAHELEDEIREIRVNDQEFFTAAELEQLNSFGSLLVRPTTGGGISQLRDEVNRRAGSRDIMFIGRDFTAVTPGVFGTRARTWAQANNQLLKPLFGTDGRGRRPADQGMLASGLAWIYMSFPRDPKVADEDTEDLPIWNTVPTLTFKVRRPLASLRLPDGFDRTPYDRARRWNNAALGAYDYLARYTDYAEPACGIDRIDRPSFEAAVLFCNERGLQANGAVSLAAAPADTLDQFGLAMNAGVFPEHAGIRYFAPGAPAATTVFLTDEDIVRNSWQYSLLTPVESRASQFLCRYADEDGVEQTAGANYDTEATTANEELRLDLVNHGDVAEQVARIMLARIWYGATLTLELADPGLRIRPRDKVYIEGCGILELKDTFRVISLDHTATGTLRVQLQFEAEDLYAERGNAQSSYIPPSRIPNYGPHAPGETFRVALGADGDDRLVARNPGDAADSYLTYR